MNRFSLLQFKGEKDEEEEGISGADDEKKRGKEVPESAACTGEVGYDSRAIQLRIEGFRETASGNKLVVFVPAAFYTRAQVHFLYVGEPLAAGCCNIVYTTPIRDAGWHARKIEIFFCAQLLHAPRLYRSLFRKKMFALGEAGRQPERGIRRRRALPLFDHVLFSAPFLFMTFVERPASSLSFSLTYRFWNLIFLRSSITKLFTELSLRPFKVPRPFFSKFLS